MSSPRGLPVFFLLLMLYCQFTVQFNETCLSLVFISFSLLYNTFDYYHNLWKCYERDNVCAVKVHWRRLGSRFYTAILLLWWATAVNVGHAVSGYCNIGIPRGQIRGSTLLEFWTWPLHSHIIRFQWGVIYNGWKCIKIKVCEIFFSSKSAKIFKKVKFFFYSFLN